MNIDYVKETVDLLNKKIEETRNLCCNLFDAESNLIDFDSKFKEMSFLKRKFNSKLTEERNTLVEIIQRISGKIKASQKTENEIKADVISYCRKKVMDNNLHYETKIDDIENEISEVKKVFEPINKLNNLAISSINNINGTVKAVNDYYEFTKNFGATNLIRTMAVSEARKSTHNALVDIENLKINLPIVKTKIENSSPDYDVNYIDVAINTMKNSQHRDIVQSNDIAGFNSQHSKFNNILAVTSAVHSLLYDEAIRLRDIMKDLDLQIVKINKEIDIEVRIIMRSYNIEI